MNKLNASSMQQMEDFWLSISHPQLLRALSPSPPNPNKKIFERHSLIEFIFKWKGK